MSRHQNVPVGGDAMASNPYVIDLPFEVDLCLRQIQGWALRQRMSWRTPTEIITEALYFFADHWCDYGDDDDEDDHRPRTRRHHCPVRMIRRP